MLVYPCAMHQSDFIVIAGSTRPNRRSPLIAEWIAELGEQVAGAPFQVIDLRELDLRLDDEAGIPAIHGYTKATTKAWGRLVSDAKGVVIVTPQYNWGYPAVLKNAIDHLYKEWQDKPVLIVTYGGHGGLECGKQLRTVLGALGTRLAASAPGLRLTRDRVASNDGRINPALELADHVADLQAALKELMSLSSG